MLSGIILCNPKPFDIFSIFYRSCSYSFYICKKFLAAYIYHHSLLAQFANVKISWYSNNKTRKGPFRVATFHKIILKIYSLSNKKALLLYLIFHIFIWQNNIVYSHIKNRNVLHSIPIDIIKLLDFLRSHYIHQH